MRTQRYKKTGSKLEAEEDEEDKEPEFDPRENARMTFKFLDINKDGQLSEDEFVDGCLGDPMMMCMFYRVALEFSPRLYFSIFVRLIHA